MNRKQEVFSALFVFGIVILIFAQLAKAYTVGGLAVLGNDNATYLGSTTVRNTIKGSLFMSAVTGQATHLTACLTAYTDNPSNPVRFKFALYDGNMGLGGDLLSQTIEGTSVDREARNQWYTLPLENPVNVVEGNWYVLCAWAGGGTYSDVLIRGSGTSGFQDFQTYTGVYPQQETSLIEMFPLLLIYASVTPTPPTTPTPATTATPGPYPTPSYPTYSPAPSPTPTATAGPTSSPGTSTQPTLAPTSAPITPPVFLWGTDYFLLASIAGGTLAVIGAVGYIVYSDKFKGKKK